MDGSEQNATAVSKSVVRASLFGEFNRGYRYTRMMHIDDAIYNMMCLRVVRN